MSYQDKTLQCRDCGQDFVFTAGEQEYYAQKGFTNEPRRCPSCRQARKAQQGGGGSYGSSSSYGSSYGNGGGSYGGGYERAPRQMFDAVCSNCGKETQGPFQPPSGGSRAGTAAAAAATAAPATKPGRVA